MILPFDNSYARLPARFYARVAPTPVREARLLALNRPLAAELGLDAAALESEEGLAMLVGNRLPEGAASLAQVYAGHQFGGWVPQLGDGRAILVGELIDRHGRRRDVQLKGAGQTPFSRRGDGRAWLGPVLREYLVSEAMFALGVPTTRALAAVATGETVHRERPYPGAVLTRVALSHVRVGTFQFFASRGDTEGLRALFEHVLARHYPTAGTALDLLREVLARQASLVARWMGLGFIHGVMNTDNVQVAGETIDYGPCAFMDAYHPTTVYSSIDHGGRYAYGRQPEVMVWNLAQLGVALLPLVDEDEEKAVAAVSELLAGAAPAMRAAWLAEFRRKLGLVADESDARLATSDTALIERLLAAMAAGAADFTNTFRALPRLGSAGGRLLEWAAEWARRLAEQGDTLDDVAPRLRAVNPARIPRNHRVEQAIQAALRGDFSVFERLMDSGARPFEDSPDFDDLRAPPQPHEVVAQTFCGT